MPKKSRKQKKANRRGRLRHLTARTVDIAVCIIIKDVIRLAYDAIAGFI
ncbi:hypothetical protein [Chelativorans alearense]|nr:hypothetical protein [Chelativorans alearense]